VPSTAEITLSTRGGVSCSDVSTTGILRARRSR
jgi:hypothetical protein